METVNVPTPEEPIRKDNRGSRAVGGLIVVAVGVIWLLKESSFVLFPAWVFTWPMILIAWGLFVGVRKGFYGGGWQVLLLIGCVFLIPEVFPNYSISDYTWPLLIISIGLYMILRPKPDFRNSARFRDKWRHQGQAFGNIPFENRPFENPQSPLWGAGAGGGQAETSAEDYIDETSIFGGIHKVVVSKNFKGGDIVNIFGGCDINFTQADFTGTITIDTVQIFGGAKIIVPTNWKVVIKTTSVFGGVEDKRPPALIKENPDKTLIITGTAIFGGVSIQCY